MMDGELQAKQSGDFIKIQPSSEGDHMILTHFKEIKFDFHLAAPPSSVPFRVAIKGLPTQTACSTIPDELTTLGYNMLSKVVQLTRRSTKKPTKVFMAALMKNQGVNKILKSKVLLGLDILVEPYRSKSIPQCFNCNFFYHTAHTCHAASRCLKCGDAHQTRKCLIRKLDNSTCINCHASGHVASSRRCPMFPKPNKTPASDRAVKKKSTSRKPNLVGSIKSDKTKKPSEDINKLISELRTPLNFKQRFMLKVLLIPMSRRAVQCRESSKSLLIRGVDAWRKGYTRLAQLMAIEGRIPDHDLLFFMTLEEIKELLATRSPRIIAKAIRRRRRHPTLDKYIFPEISKGFPKPINMETHPIVTNDDSFSMQGIPVSQGVTKGFVRVAITLEEASFLQPGEILVTYSTDIGWSPYFPMLAGVVTELGGLISHGAVVSREYGLPCIAGLHGATRQFQTGDYVLMDGNKGILQKLPRPEKE